MAETIVIMSFAANSSLQRDHFTAEKVADSSSFLALFLFFPVLFILGFFSKPLFSPESLKYCVVDYVSGFLVVGVMELKCFAIFNF